MRKQSKRRLWVMLWVMPLAACSGKPAETAPPFAEIEKASLAYVECIDKAATALAGQSGNAESLAQQALRQCEVRRNRALALKAVPVMAPSIADFDAMNLDLARQRIAAARAKQ